MADEIKQSVVIDLLLGQVRSDLQKLQGEFRQAFGNISSVGSTLLGAIGVGSIGAFTKEVIDLGGHLDDLNKRTDVSVEFLSGFKSVLEENGSSVDAFANAVFNLQKNLGNVDDDSDKVAIAIKRLGLNLNELRNGSTDEFIKKISDSLAKIENPVERNTLLFNLLGKQAKELGPVFAELTGKFDEFKSKGLSAETVAALDLLGDAFTRLKNSALSFGATSLAQILQGLGVVQRSADLIRRDIEDTLKFAPSDIGRLQALRRELAGALEAQAAKAENKAPAPFALPKKADTSLTSTAEQIDRENDALQAQIDELVRGKDAAQDNLLAQKELQETAKGTSAAIIFEIFRRRDLIAQLREEQRAREELLGRIRAENILKGPPEETNALRSFEELRQAQEATDKANAEFRERLARDRAAAEEFWLKHSIEQARSHADEQKRVWEDLQSAIKSGFDDTFRGIFQGTQSFSEGMKNLFRNLGLALVNELSQSLIGGGKNGGGGIGGILAQIIGLFGGGGRPQGVEGPLQANGSFFSNNWGSLLSLFGSFFGGSFDTGGVVPGPIGAPQFAVVHGGETILPTHRQPGAGQVIYNIDARGAQRGVSAEIQRAIEQSRRQAVQESVSTVVDERRRSNRMAKVFGK